MTCRSPGSEASVSSAATRSPVAAKARATAAPIPREAPVTSTARPLALALLPAINAASLSSCLRRTDRFKLLPSAPQRMLTLGTVSGSWTTPDDKPLHAGDPSLPRRQDPGGLVEVGGRGLAVTACWPPMALMPWVPRDASVKGGPRRQAARAGARQRRRAGRALHARSPWRGGHHPGDSPLQQTRTG